MHDTMKLRIDGQAARKDESMFNERVDDSTIVVEQGDIIVSDGPISIEVIEDAE